MARPRGCWLQAVSFVVIACLCLEAGGASPAQGSPQALPPPVASDFPARLEALQLAEDYVEAFALAADLLAERSGRLGPDAPGTLAALQRLGAIAHLSGEQDVAEELTRIALQRRQLVFGNEHRDVAESLYWLGLVTQYHAEPKKAGVHFDEALALLTRLGEGRSPLAGAVLQAQASLLRRTDLGAAAAKYREALALRQACRPRPTLAIADNETWLGHCLFRAGRFDEAMPLLKSAERELRALRAANHSLMGTILNFYGNECALREDWPAAERYYRATIEAFARSRAGYLPGFARRRLPLDGGDFLALALLKQGRPAEAWPALAAAHGHLSAEFVMLSQWSRRAPATFEQVTRQRREYFLQRRRYLERWSQTADPLPAAAWPSLLQSLRNYAAIARLEREYLATCWRDTPDSEAQRRRLEPGSALIGWLQINVGADERRSSGDLRAGAWGFVARADRPVQWFPLWDVRGAAALREALAPPRRYIRRRDRASEWATTAAADPELLADARAISAKWFHPMLPALAGVDRIIVDASSLPFAIPVDAFVLPDGRYVGDAFTISYLPSLSAEAWQGPEPPAREAAARRLLAVSASSSLPMPTRSRGSRGRGAEPGSGRMMEPLPGAEEECARIATLFTSATRFRPGEAHESRLLEMAADGSLGDFDVIHIASHALPDNHPERNAVLLEAPGGRGDPDGQVNAREIVGLWQLRGSLVSLSGCESSFWTGFGRGEFNGMVPALLAAGARNILGSQWPVQDRATSLLMTRFYENLQGRYPGTRGGRTGEAMRPDVALHEARTWLRLYADERGRHPFEHPVYWSGFVLVAFF